MSRLNKPQEEEPPQEPPGPSTSSSSAETSPMDLGEPPEQKQTRCSPAEREDSKQKCQRPAEANEVLTLARVLQLKRSCCLDTRSTREQDATLENYETWTNLESLKWSTGRKVAERAQTAIGLYIQSANCGKKCCTNGQSERRWLCWYSKTHHVSRCSHACCNEW